MKKAKNILLICGLVLTIPYQKLHATVENPTLLKHLTISLLASAAILYSRDLVLEQKRSSSFRNIVSYLFVIISCLIVAIDYFVELSLVISIMAVLNFTYAYSLHFRNRTNYQFVKYIIIGTLLVGIAIW